MSTLALVLTDFHKQLPFSNKIEEEQIRPFIEFARTLDMVPLLGYATLEAVDRLPVPTLSVYVTGATLPAGAIVSTFNERIYSVAPGTPSPLSAPPATPKDTVAGWTYEPLMTLWLHYLKKWWVEQSFARFLGQHGLNITKAGITVPLDRNQGTYDRPSAAQKAELQASVDITAEALKSRLARFLREEHLLYADCGAGYNYYPNEGGAMHSTRSDRRHTRRVRAV